MDRFNANKIIATGFVLTAFAIYAIGQVAEIWPAGCGRVRGRHADEYGPVVAAGFAAGFYPTNGRRPALPGCWVWAGSAASPDRSQLSAPATDLQRDLHDPGDTG